MAPFPEEIDVFTVPHSRMKELVDVYLRKLPATDFADHCALESLLHELQRTFYEFKSHENIENLYIMKKLKSKLNALRIHNSTVCDCHSDNRLSEMLALVKDGYRCCTSKSASDRINYGLHLKRALGEFTDTFLPHMREEEEVFQPLLMKYFDYEELKTLKEMVIQRHTEWKEECLEEQLEKFCLETKENDEGKEKEKYFSYVPPEVLLKVFSFLSPFDLVRCRGVNRQWSKLSCDQSLWRHMDPVQWARGNFAKRKTFQFAELQPENYEHHCNNDYDSWLDTDEKEEIFLHNTIEHLLPYIGDSVQTLVLRGSKSLTSVQLSLFLGLCPNITHLDISYTNVTGRTFESLQVPLCQKLTHLDASGCCGVDDNFIFNLTLAWRGFSSDHRLNQVACAKRGVCCRRFKNNCASGVTTNCKDAQRRNVQRTNLYTTQKRVEQGLVFLNLSGCHRITDNALMRMAQMGMLTPLEFLDVSGCCFLTGEGLKYVVDQCPHLKPENLSYCNNIDDGPSPDNANGCQNVGSRARFCCSFGQF